MPDSLAHPWFRRAVVELMGGERLARFSRIIVDKLITLADGHTLGCRRRLASRGTRLEPRLAAIICALNNLAEPTTCLRGVKTDRSRRRSFDVVDLPTGKMRTTYVPLFTL